MVTFCSASETSTVIHVLASDPFVVASGPPSWSKEEMIWFPSASTTSVTYPPHSVGKGSAYLPHRP